jgi:hypothetical protein
MTTDVDKVRIQVGTEVWETDIWTLPLMAEAILRSTGDEVKMDVDERELMEAPENSAA